MAPILLSAPMQGWALPIDQVPDAVFADRMLGTKKDPAGYVTTIVGRAAILNEGWPGAEKAPPGAGSP